MPENKTLDVKIKELKDKKIAGILKDLDGKDIFSLNEVYKFSMLKSPQTGKTVKSLATARTIIKRMNYKKPELGGHKIKAGDIVLWNMAVDIIQGTYFK